MITAMLAASLLLSATATPEPASDVAYEPADEPVEPWEPNVTALADPEKLKWKDLVSSGRPGTPIPTPWPKEEFETQAAAILEAAAGDARPEPAGGRDGRPVPGAAGGGDETPAERPPRGQGSASTPSSG